MATVKAKAVKPLVVTVMTLCTRICQRIPCMWLVAAILIAASASGADAARFDYTPLAYNNPDAYPPAKVGLIGSAIAFDWDGDGDRDIVIGCGGIKTWFGLWLFENPSAPGSKEVFPVFKPGRKVGDGQRNLFAKTYPDGRVMITRQNMRIDDFRKTGWHMQPFKGLEHNLRHANYWLEGNVWTMVDYDGDGREDIVAGVGDRKPYGWDNAYNGNGVWTNGNFRGMFYLVRNQSTAPQEEKWGAPEPILLEDNSLMEVNGSAIPMFHDWDGDGDLDVIASDFADGFTYFENVGTRTNPIYTAGRILRDSKGGRLHGDSCITAGCSAIDWDNDGLMDFMFSQETACAEVCLNTGKLHNGMPVFRSPVYLRAEADKVHCGILVTPAGVDWDGDGDCDIITGNSAGYIAFIENLSGPGVASPKWAEPKYLSCRPFDASRSAASLGGMVSASPIRILAGYSGSIQGPAEAKFGYTCLSVADWNGDGLPDIMVNSIWGKPLVFLNIGTRTKPTLDAKIGVEVEWDGPQPELGYGWYKPQKMDKPKELITQWRTTPVMFDMNRDGLMDLVMLDQEGYLAFFERARRADGTLFLKHPRRAFTCGPKRTLLRPNNRRGGGSGRRKLSIGDWDGDGMADIILDGRNSKFYRQIEKKDGVWHFDVGVDMSDQKLNNHSTSPAFVDFDNDGIPEMLLGCEDGFFYHLKNNDWKKTQPPANRALVPVAPFEKLEYDWTNRHARILREQRALDPEIILLGDSITHEWAGRKSIGGTDALSRFKRAFEGYRVLDAGYGGDRIQNILWRLENGELDGVKPKLVVILAGTNNLNLNSKADPTLKDSTPDEIVEGIVTIAERLRRKLPSAHVLILGVFPRGCKPGGRCRVAGAEINKKAGELLKGMASVTFADIGDVFLDADGVFPEDVSYDALHLKDEGFRRWREALQPYIAKHVDGQPNGKKGTNR